MTDQVIQQCAEHLEIKSPLEILQWAAREFGPRLTFATGFGAEGCVLIDLIGRHRLNIDLFTLDTGLLFRETYELWKQLEDKYDLNIRSIRPAQTVEEQADAHGNKLWERDSDKCCELRKVLPLREALKPFTAWISAIRRDQTRDRADVAVVERDRRYPLIKISPLVRWTSEDVWKHLREFSVPYNPLHDQGYPSIGCWPCTSPVAPGEDPRAGRWRGSAKKECGLHLRLPLNASVPQEGSK
jgi:phosphoadenosine phosphosulfate reductase